MKEAIYALRGRLASLVVLMLLVGAFLVPAAVQAAAVDDICAGVNIGSSEACGSDTSRVRVSTVVKAAIDIFSLVVGIAAIIMIIVSGLKFIISGGESSNINAARSTLLYAVIGLVVVALAQFIVRFVLAKAT